MYISIYIYRSERTCAGQLKASVLVWSPLEMLRRTTPCSRCTGGCRNCVLESGEILEEH